VASSMPRVSFSPTTEAHAAHDEAAVGEAQDDPDALDESLADDGGLFEPRSFLLGLDPLEIGPAVIESEGVERLKTGKPFLEGVGVEQVGKVRS